MKIRSPRIGLLPLYIALYDEVAPKVRQELGSFITEVTAAFRQEEIEVIAAPICCVEKEVKAALEKYGDRLCISQSQLTLEKGENYITCPHISPSIDLLVTLHLAYSPSLESAHALAASPFPLLMFDSTPDLDFGPDVDPALLMYNHGIHGVQDLSAMLRRLRKPYQIAAGHLSHPQLMTRASDMARAAYSANRMRATRALRVGFAFQGMGDFQVDSQVLQNKFGIRVEEIMTDALFDDAAQITDLQIEEELALDNAAFTCDISPETHRRSVRLGLGLRAYLERGDYSAFSMNFLAFDRGDEPLCTVPFLECSKAMARGIGYAGEGDVLTASLVGALQAGFGNTTFTEMFCPDWKNGSIFISHMGEINPKLSKKKPLLFEKPFTFTPAQNPAVLGCAPCPGPATLVNLSPGPDDTFRLIIAPVEILEDGTHPEMSKLVRGWLKPAQPLEQFLERYSQLGGTHHSALMLGDHHEALLAFAEWLGIEGCVIEGNELRI